jgi:hypothetical protein
LSSVAAIRNGEWFQDLYGWSRILDLGHRASVEQVQLEANDAGHVDDVVSWPSDAKMPVEYAQLKFHVGGESGRYSVESFIELPAASRRTKARGGRSRGTSLLQKFFVSWVGLRQKGRPIRLVLHSNWSWDDADPLAPLISGLDDRMSSAFFSALDSSPVGAARERWRSHVGADPDEFEQFIRALHFRVGRGSIQQLEEIVSMRMRDRGLYSDSAAVERAVARVGKWIREGVQTITPTLYAETLLDLQLLLPESDPAIRVNLQTVERQAYVEAADYTLDWCEHFVPNTDTAPFPRGHRLYDPGAWQGVLLPELRALKASLNATSIRLLRVRGQARLSAWIGFGHVFDGRSRYILELEQNGQAWRTDATPHRGAALLTVTGRPVTTVRGSELAVVVAITNPILPAVERAFAELALPISTLISISPVDGPSRHALDSAQGMTAMVEEVRRAVSNAVANTAAGRVHLFYSGPLSLAAALGHAMGAAAPELQVYEYDIQGGYLPSFLLHS